MRVQARNGQADSQCKISPRDIHLSNRKTPAEPASMLEDTGRRKCKHGQWAGVATLPQPPIAAAMCHCPAHTAFAEGRELYRCKRIITLVRRLYNMLVFITWRDWHSSLLGMHTARLDECLCAIGW